MMSGSSAMILPKCASSTFISSPETRLHTYRFFLQKWSASPSVFQKNNAVLKNRVIIKEASNF